MKKVLIAVDETKGSKAILSVFDNMVSPPDEIILLHVERIEGKSLMTAMLGDAEMSTLKESIKGTEHKEALDKKAESILAYFKKELENGGLVTIRTVIREGNPVDEILKLAEEEGVELIITGANEKTMLDRLITGRVSRTLERSAKVPVLIVKSKTKKSAVEKINYTGLKLRESH